MRKRSATLTANIPSYVIGSFFYKVLANLQLAKQSPSVCESVCCTEFIHGHVASICSPVASSVAGSDGRQ